MEQSIVFQKPIFNISYSKLLPSISGTWKTKESSMQDRACSFFSQWENSNKSLPQQCHTIKWKHRGWTSNVLCDFPLCTIYLSINTKKSKTIQTYSPINASHLQSKTCLNLYQQIRRVWIGASGTLIHSKRPGSPGAVGLLLWQWDLVLKIICESERKEIWA